VNVEPRVEELGVFVYGFFNILAKR